MAAQLTSAALGVWLMLAPDVWGFVGASRTHHYILGPIVATFGIIAAWEHMRPLRWVNVLAGAWLILSSSLFGGAEPDAILNAFCCGGLIVLFSCMEGTYRPLRFGGGWAALFRPGAR